MKTFELTYSIRIEDGEIDMDQLEKDLRHLESTDLNFIEMEVVEPTEVHVTYEMRADNIGDCPDELSELNDHELVEDPELYTTELVSHTSY